LANLYWWRFLEKHYLLSNELGIYLVGFDILSKEMSQFYKKWGFKEFLDD